jgi:V/A-type H+-transporting ATPase subunit B
VLPSLSRLMKDGIGAGYTREDHAAVANALFAAYAAVQNARALSSVIGEEELSEIDKAYMEFGRLFETYFLQQRPDEARTIEQTLELGWDLLSLLPIEELSGVEKKYLDAHYDPKRGQRLRMLAG